MRFATALLSLLASCLPAFAQVGGNPVNWCREGFFTRDSIEFGLAKVKGSKGTRVYFHSDAEADCPGSPSCREKAYLIPGNEVIVNRTYQGYACAWYSPVKGKTSVGWIRESDLSISKMIPGSYRSWLGEWTYGSNGIEFTENKLPGFLNVTGNAMWQGLGDNVHVGEIDGRYEPRNGVIEYSDGNGEYDCRITMRLLGRYLIVADNLNCGGVNVSFSGIYARKKN